MEGRLKQKLQGVDGILCWRMRHFVLDVRARSVDVTDTSVGFVGGEDGNMSSLVTAMPGVGGSDPDFGDRLAVARVSLDGARRAVAWSGINAFNGCGFDLVWASGRAWSLLCEDPHSRKSWVDALNLCIRESPSVPDCVLDDQGGAATRGRPEGGVTYNRPPSNRRYFRPASPSPSASTTTSTGGRPQAEGGLPSPLPPPHHDHHHRRRGKDIPVAGVSYPVVDPKNVEEKKKARPTRGEVRGGEDEHFSSSFDDKKGEQSEDSRSSSEWAAHVAPPTVAGVLDTTFDEGQGQGQDFQWQRRRQQQHRRVRSRRREENLAESSGQAYSDFSDKQAGVFLSSPQSPSSGVVGLAAPRFSGGRRATRETGAAGKVRGGGEDEAIDASIGSSSCGGVSCDKGKRDAGRSKARERSEELARASAATWDQFQQLLEKSRQSKARFDRVMDGASEPAAAAAGGGGGSGGGGKKSVSRSRLLSDRTFHRSSGKHVGHDGVVEEIGNTPSEFPVGFVASQPQATVGTEADAAAAPTSAAGRGTRTSSSASSPSSTDRLPPAPPTTTCDVSDDGCGDTSDDAIAAGVVALGGHTGARDRNNYQDPAEDSRISALTAVEKPRATYDARERAASGDGRRPRPAEEEADGSREGEGPREGKQQQRRRRHSLESLSAAPATAAAAHVAPPQLVEGPVKRSIDTTGHDRDDSTVAIATVTATAAADSAVAGKRISRLEEELEAARSEGVARTERCLRLERDLATALAANVSAHTAEQEEVQRLRRELEALKAAAREEGEKDRAEASARAAFAERERYRADATAAKAKVEADAVAAAMQSRVDASLAEVLEAKKRGEREREEVVRQKDELEKALAAEINERRRVSDLLEAASRSENSLREQLEATADERDLKARLMSARSKLEAVTLERNSLAEELDQCIGRLGDQAREVASALRSRQQREITEISSRCEVEKEAIREQLALEADERAREHTRSALLAQERRLRAEAAAAARREAKLRDNQAREAKAESEAAGAATRNDIEKLRGLHARRVKRLETLARDEGERLADARREIAACKATLAGNAGEFQRWTEGQQDQSKRLLEELARIQKKVDGAVAMEGEAREREGLAMSRLRKVMEEARLERAEGVEVRRQLREALAELESDRGAHARRARTDVQLQRAADIAQQEVAMLEAERTRWHEERRSMEEALDRLTRLVYGPSSGSNNNNNTSNTTIMNTTTTSRSTPTFPWKPAGAGGNLNIAAAAARGGHAKKQRAACSPIGVNVAAARGGVRVVSGAGRR